VPDNCILVPITVIGTVMICIVHKFIKFVFIQIHLACVAFIVFIIFIMSAGLAITFHIQVSFQEKSIAQFYLPLNHLGRKLWKADLTFMYCMLYWNYGK